MSQRRSSFYSNRNSRFECDYENCTYSSHTKLNLRRHIDTTHNERKIHKSNHGDWDLSDD